MAKIEVIINRIWTETQNAQLKLGSLRVMEQEEYNHVRVKIVFI